jgi:CubicO group peptidase (beta-lactamase class C family)
MILHHRRNRSGAAFIGSRKCHRPAIEILERRTLLTSSPLGPQFQQQFQSLLQQYDFPQGSIAVIQNGQTFTYGATNTSYPFAGTAPSAPAPDALFRVASLSKTITAMAILKLVQDGQIGLNDSALGDLGYTVGETISGRNPSDGSSVSVQIDPELMKITIQNLLNMASGLEYNIPEVSAAFSKASTGDITTSVAGSYAALGFAPAPSGGNYTSPATMAQMVNYEVYEVSAQPSLMMTAPGSSYYYNNINYGILSLIIAKDSGVSSPDPATQYWDFVETQILGPLGVSAAGVSPAEPAMVGLGSTLEQDAYPTEVQYYPQVPLVSSIFPDPSKTLPGDLPETPTTDVPPPYGGAVSVESIFGFGGLVATPTALAIVLNNLSQVYAGAATGPLSQASVQAMVAPPVNPATGQLPANDSKSYWFGMGLDIYPNSVSGTSWERFGSLDGTSAFMERFLDGTVMVATFNSRMDNAENGYVSQLQQIVAAALFSPPIANDLSSVTTVNTPVVINVLANDTDPNPDGVFNPASVLVAGPSHGSTSLNSTTGAVTYTPDPGFLGTDQFTYTVSDNFGLTSNVATVTIQVAPAAVTAATVYWGAVSAPLYTAADGLLLLPAGRNTDLPWLGIDSLQITLDGPESLTASDVTVKGLKVKNDGPVAISGSGTTYTITLARRIKVADRVTITIAAPNFMTYIRELDVLPGDFDDDGVVNERDVKDVRNEFHRTGGAQPTIFGDIVGDGTVDARDVKAMQRLVGTRLPNPPRKHRV